jgi:hypothetical protein
MKYFLLASIVILSALMVTAQQPSAAGGGRGPAGASGGRGGGGRAQPDPVDFNDHPGWTQMFDGQTLNGWDGNPAVWKVIDGNIGCEFNGPEGTCNQGGFIAWKGGDIGDFEIKLEIKLEGSTADSGI